VHEIDATERYHRARWKRLVTLQLAIRQGLPYRLSISRWALTPSVLRNFRMLPLKTSSFICSLHYSIISRFSR
jgi:hypothetical protein